MKSIVKDIYNIISVLALVFIVFMGIMMCGIFIPQWYPIIRENELLYGAYIIFYLVGIYKVITHFFE